MISNRGRTVSRGVCCAAVAVVVTVCGAGDPRAAPVPPQVVCWSLRDAFVAAGPPVGPGGRATGVVEIENACGRAVTARLLAGRTVTGADGMVGWSPRESEAGVLVLDGSEVTVAAGGTARVSFTFSVAADAVAGDHPLAVAAVDADGSRPAGAAVDTWRPIPLRVAGTVRAAVEITDVAGEYRPVRDPFAPGSAEIGFTVTNTGTVTVMGRVVAGLSGLYSTRILPDLATVPTVVLVPGASYTGTVRLSGVWPGVRFDAQVGFLPTDIGGVPVTFGEPGVVVAETMWALPVPQAALVVAAGSLLFAAALVRRRRHLRRAGAESGVPVRHM
ncbi:hypothetical protein OG225_35970 [Nocardia sp. NBC_01377]|uniref:hypothetical protein n=1 Tax=Nocardia sp. NBC_01377 TaxID=2903595 RepID=UPI0032550014